MGRGYLAWATDGIVSQDREIMEAAWDQATQSCAMLEAVMRLICGRTSVATTSDHKRRRFVQAGTWPGLVSMPKNQALFASRRASTPEQVRFQEFLLPGPLSVSTGILVARATVSAMDPELAAIRHSGLVQTYTPLQTSTCETNLQWRHEINLSAFWQLASQKSWSACAAPPKPLLQSRQRLGASGSHTLSKSVNSCGGILHVIV